MENKVSFSDASEWEEYYVLPSPTMDGDIPENTHISLFAYTDEELICGKNFGRYEGDIKAALKNVEGVFDADHKDVSDIWAIE